MFKVIEVNQSEESYAINVRKSRDA